MRQASARKFSGNFSVNRSSNFPEGYVVNQAPTVEPARRRSDSARALPLALCHCNHYPATTCRQARKTRRCTDLARFEYKPNWA